MVISAGNTEHVSCACKPSSPIRQARSIAKRTKDKTSAINPVDP